MLRETQEARNDLSGDAAGTADGLRSSRRGFLSGTGLGAIGVAIGGGMPFSNDSGSLIPAANAQGAQPAPAPAAPPPPPSPGGARRPEGSDLSEISRQERRLGRARRSPARCRDAGKPARR